MFRYSAYDNRAVCFKHFLTFVLSILCQGKKKRWRRPSVNQRPSIKRCVHHLMRLFIHIRAIRVNLINAHRTCLSTKCGGRACVSVCVQARMNFKLDWNFTIYDVFSHRLHHINDGGMMLIQFHLPRGSG